MVCDCDRDHDLLLGLGLDVLLSSRLSRTSLDLNFDFWVNLLLLLQVRQRPLYTNPQATTMQDDAICLVGS